MCGIAGIHGRVEGAQRALRRMVDAQVHRGPDDQGLHLDEACGLGVRRLSIIDVAGGHQPIYDETSHHVIVFNGEVYNFADLRTDLEAASHRFRTHSDMPVVIARATREPAERSGSVLPLEPTITPLKVFW